MFSLEFFQVTVNPNSFTITVGSGLTATTTTSGSDKITKFTSGSGSVSFE